jgi:hypothetical protein
VKLVVKQCCEAIKKDVQIMVGILGATAGAGCIVTTGAFALPIFLQEYQDTDSAQNYINAKVSQVLFISQFMSIATALGVGLLADRYTRIWRFALFFTALQLLIVIGFYLSSKTSLKAEPLDKGETNVLQLLCYAGIQTLNISYTMLFQIIFQRAVEPYKESLGALYGFWYVYKSIIGITVYYYGGSLSAESAALPILIPTALLALQVALMLVLFSL